MSKAPTRTFVRRLLRCEVMSRQVTIADARAFEKFLVAVGDSSGGWEWVSSTVVADRMRPRPLPEDSPELPVAQRGGRHWSPEGLMPSGDRRPSTDRPAHETRHRTNSIIRPGRAGTTSQGCPRQDSNLRHRLRRAVLYPLSYGGQLVVRQPVKPGKPSSAAAVASASGYRRHDVGAGRGAPPNCRSSCSMATISLVCNCSIFPARFRTYGSVAWATAYCSMGRPPWW